jgi:hypothetical protein
MAMTGPDEFQRRARRAYEWGRLRHAAATAWPALPLTLLSGWLCHEPGLSAIIGASLFSLLTGLVWYGRIGSRAASAGLKGGIVAFTLPVLAFHSYFAPCCSSLSGMLITNGVAGIVVGVLLSFESTRVPAQRDLFLALASAVAALCGLLGCVLFGPPGLAGMGAGIFLSTAPVAIYRRATA